jgi:hypothetical protein
MKNKVYNIVGTVPKYNWKIIETKVIIQKSLFVGESFQQITIISKMSLWDIWTCVNHVVCLYNGTVSRPLSKLC